MLQLTDEVIDKHARVLKVVFAAFLQKILSKLHCTPFIIPLNSEIKRPRFNVGSFTSTFVELQKREKNPYRISTDDNSYSFVKPKACKCF